MSLVVFQPQAEPAQQTFVPRVTYCPLESEQFQGLSGAVGGLVVSVARGAIDRLLRAAGREPIRVEGSPVSERPIQFRSDRASCGICSQQLQFNDLLYRPKTCPGLSERDVFHYNCMRRRLDEHNLQCPTHPDEQLQDVYIQDVRLSEDMTVHVDGCLRPIEPLTYETVQKVVETVSRIPIFQEPELQEEARHALSDLIRLLNEYYREDADLENSGRLLKKFVEGFLPQMSRWTETFIQYDYDHYQANVPKVLSFLEELEKISFPDDANMNENELEVANAFKGIISFLKYQTELNVLFFYSARSFRVVTDRNIVYRFFYNWILVPFQALFVFLKMHPKNAFFLNNLLNKKIKLLNNIVSLRDREGPRTANRRYLPTEKDRYYFNQFYSLMDKGNLPSLLSGINLLSFICQVLASVLFRYFVYRFLIPGLVKVVSLTKQFSIKV